MSSISRKMVLILIAGISLCAAATNAPPDTLFSTIIDYGNKFSPYVASKTKITQVIRTRSGSYIGVGSASCTTGGPTGALFVCIDSTGQKLWDTVYTADSSVAGAIIQENDTLFMVAGATNEKLHLWDITIKGNLVRNTLFTNLAIGQVKVLSKYPGFYLIGSKNGITKLNADLSAYFVPTGSCSSINLTGPSIISVGDSGNTTIVAILDTSLSLKKRRAFNYDITVSQDPNAELTEVHYAGIINNNRFFSVGSNRRFYRTSSGAGVLQFDTVPRVKSYVAHTTFGFESAWFGKADSDSEIVVGGETYRDAFIRKIKTDGTIVWERTINFGANIFERMLFVSSTPDGGYIACGDASNDPLAPQKGFIIKFGAPGPAAVKNGALNKSEIANNHTITPIVTTAGLLCIKINGHTAHEVYSLTGRKIAAGRFADKMKKSSLK